MRLLNAFLLGGLLAGLLLPSAHAQAPRGFFLDLVRNELTEADLNTGVVLSTTPFPAPGFPLDFVGVTDPSGSVGYVSDGVGGIWKIDLAASPPVIDPTPIPVSNVPGDLAVTSDGRFLFAAESVGAPLSVVDLTAGAEVSTFDVAQNDHGAVAVCDNGTDVLVMSFLDQAIYRGIFDPLTGTITNTGESFSVPAETALTNVECAPGSVTGVAVGLNSLSAYSFLVDGMAFGDGMGAAVVLDVGAPVMGLEFDPAGTTLYLHTTFPGTLIANTYDPATGLFGSTLFSTPIPDALALLGVDRIALSSTQIGVSSDFEVRTFALDGTPSATFPGFDFASGLCLDCAPSEDEGKLSITLTPHNPPIVVTSNSEFSFDFTITNNDDETRTFDVWFNIVGQTSGVDITRGRRQLTLTPGQTVTRTRTQPIPTPPLDTYTMRGLVGTFDTVIEDEDSFEFQVAESAGRRAGAAASDLASAEASWTEAAWAAATTDAPAGVVLEQNTPNPFGPATTLRFALPEATDVRLAVYDLLGREVAVLVDGPLGAGPHEAQLEAGGLAAGPYLYRLEAAGEVHVRRMTLLE